MGILYPCLTVYPLCVPVLDISIQARTSASTEISRTGTLLFYLVRATGYNAAKVQVMTSVPQPTGFGTGVKLVLKLYHIEALPVCQNNRHHRLRGRL